MIDLSKYEELFSQKITQIATTDDPAHDILHFLRVVKTAKKLCALEKAKPEVVVPAAWLHDFVIVPKNSPLRSQASQLSAKAAVEFLISIEYPMEFHSEIAHAIEAHSFSAKIEAKTIEAKIVQDADRLDGIGAIGVARCFATSGLLKRQFYSPNDAFCVQRKPNDQVYTIDHFYQKLFHTAETLQTRFGRVEGIKRVITMKNYLNELAKEILES